MFKRSVTLITALGFLVLSMAGCTPGSEQTPTTEENVPAPAESANSPALQTQTTTAPTQSPDTSTQDVIVESTPLSEAELANQPPGTAPGGAGESGIDGGGSDPYPGLVEDIQPNPADWPTYTDPTYGFAIAHPADFVIRPPANPDQLSPAPAATIRFMSPAVANSDVATSTSPNSTCASSPPPKAIPWKTGWRPAA